MSSSTLSRPCGREPERQISLHLNQVLTYPNEGDKKAGMFEFAICVNPAGQERRVVRFVKLPEAMENQLRALVAESTMSDDLVDTKAKLDILRQQMGITSGWGMEPGDVGYQPPGMPSLNPLQPSQSATSPEAVANATV